MNGCPPRNTEAEAARLDPEARGGGSGAQGCRGLAPSAGSMAAEMDGGRRGGAARLTEQAAAEEAARLAAEKAAAEEAARLAAEKAAAEGDALEVGAPPPPCQRWAR